MRLTEAQLDRAAGALLGLAAGDALGAGYEFGTPPSEKAEMIGGGLGDWEPGEWTDDTQMAICIAEVAAAGSVDEHAIGQRFLDWWGSSPKDVGNQTRQVLGAAGGAEDLHASAAAHLAQNPHGAAGNGSLMRTAPVALAFLGDDKAIADAAMAVSGLTHGDPLAGEACVLWCIAIDRAVREGRLDGVDDGLELLPSHRRDWWRARLHDARTMPSASFGGNGFVVTALQAALSAVSQTPGPDQGPACLHLQDALHAAVRVGHDTDTVAAIAGSLLGARWGASAVPFRWRRMLHGWPGYRATDLVRLAVLTARRGSADTSGWPGTASLDAYYRETEPRAVAVTLPEDPGVVIGNAAALAEQDVDAVVSLCRIGTAQVPAHVEHHEVMLVDKVGANANLEFVVLDAAEAIVTFRDEGKRVFLHCVGAVSRTPTVAAAYLHHRFGLSGPDALDWVADLLPRCSPNPNFRDYLATLPRRSLPHAAGRPSDPGICEPT